MKSKIYLLIQFFNPSIYFPEKLLFRSYSGFQSTSLFSVWMVCTSHPFWKLSSQDDRKNCRFEQTARFGEIQIAGIHARRNKNDKWKFWFLGTESLHHNIVLLWRKLPSAVAQEWYGNCGLQRSLLEGMFFHIIGR